MQTDKTQSPKPAFMSRLRVRLFAVFMLLSLLPVLVVSALYQYFSKRSSRDLAVMHVQESVAIVGEQVGEALSQYANTMVSLFTNIELVGQVREYEEAEPRMRYRIGAEIQKKLQLAQSNLRGVLALEVFSTERLICSVGGRTTASDPRQSEVLRETQESLTKLTWFSTRLFEQSGTIASGMMLTAKIIDFNTKQILGYVVMSINTENFNTLLTGSTFSGKGELFLTDASGVIIAHPDRSRIMTQLDPKIASTALSSSKAYQMLHLEEGNYLVCASHINNDLWRIVSLVDFDQLIRGVSQASLLANGILLLLVVLVCIAAIMLSNSISRPIRRMVRSMETINDLSLLYDAVGPSDDYEINQLSEAFEQLIQRIQRLIHENYQIKIKQMEAEFTALQAQIKPHFLYNTLDSIYWMAHSAKQRELCALVKSLSDFFKLNLNGGREFYTIADELALVRCYTNIQGIRYQDRFSISIESDVALEKFHCPKFLLQPLVENAIMHGFWKPNVEGKILVSIYQSDQKIHMEVIDDGNGFDTIPDLSGGATDPASGHGYGLLNVDRRIKLYFGSLYGVYLYNRETGGATAGLTIPPITKEEGILPYENIDFTG